MQTILEAVGVLIVLFLVLRVSLWSRGRGFGLRGGLTLLNLVSGSLPGLLAGAVLKGRIHAPGGAVAGGAGGYADLAAALRTLAPLFGAALGGIAGYLLFGALWRRLFRGGTARARGWLLRAQLALALVATAILLGGWLR